MPQRPQDQREQDVLKPGDVLQGRYRIERLLGEGGMGEVYLGVHIALDERYAIKARTIHSTNPQEQAALRKQFLEEARILAKLSHPNLAKVWDFFEEAGTDYLVMEYLEGADLGKCLGTPLPESRVLQISEQILDVLEYLHSRAIPIILKDLKPQNIIELQDKSIRLVDFGIAKTLNPQSGAGTLVRATTDGFSPPEQYQGNTDERSDLYSLGATMLCLLTGEVPGSSVARAISGGGLTDSRKDAHGIADGLWRVIERLMALNPEERPASATEARSYLRGSESTQPFGARDKGARTTPMPGLPTTDTGSASSLPTTLVAVSARTPLRRRLLSSKWSLTSLIVVLSLMGGALLWRGQVSRPAGDVSQAPTIQSSESAQIYSLAVSNDGTTVLSGGNGTVALWRVSDGKLLECASGLGGHVPCVGFLPDHSIVAAVVGWKQDYNDLEFQIVTWKNGLSGDPVRVYPRSLPFNDYPRLAFCPDRRVMALTYENSVIYEVSIDTGTCTSITVPQVYTITTVCYSPGGEIVFFGSEGMDRYQAPAVHAVRLSDGATVCVWRGKVVEGEALVSDIAYSPYEDALAVSVFQSRDAYKPSEPKLVSFFALRGQEPSQEPTEVAGVFKYDNVSRWPEAHAFSRDLKTYAILEKVTNPDLSNCSSISLYNVSTGDNVGRLSMGKKPLRTLGFSRDGKAVFTGCDVLEILDVAFAVPVNSR